MIWILAFFVILSVVLGLTLHSSNKREGQLEDWTEDWARMKHLHEYEEKNKNVS